MHSSLKHLSENSARIPPQDMGGIILLTVDKIKTELKKLKEENPRIHMDVSLVRPKLELEGAEALLVGAYAHIFQIEEYSRGEARRHTLQYSDILTGRIVIHELEKREG